MALDNRKVKHVDVGTLENLISEKDTEIKLVRDEYYALVE